MSDICMAAFVRLGESENTAVRKVAAVAALSPSRDVYDRWNTYLPEPVSKPMLAAMAGPAGEAFAREIVEHFQTELLNKLGVNESQLERYLTPSGQN